MNDLTPREIVAELDKYIIGQNQAKRAVAVAMRNRYRRSRLSDDIRADIIPKNILMIGPTGWVNRDRATIGCAGTCTVVKVEATKFTEVGYVGRNVDSMIRDLLQAAIRLVEKEKMEEVKEQATDRATDRIVDILQPRRRFGHPASQAASPDKPMRGDNVIDALNQFFARPGSQPEQPAQPPPPPPPAPTEDDKKRMEQEVRVRTLLRKQITSGVKDKDSIEIEVEESQQGPVMQVMTPGMDESGSDLQSMFGSFMPKKTRRKTVTIAEAREYFAAKKLGILSIRIRSSETPSNGRNRRGLSLSTRWINRKQQRSNRRRSRRFARRSPARYPPIIEGSTVQTKQDQSKRTTFFHCRRRISRLQAVRSHPRASGKTPDPS